MAANYCVLLFALTVAGFHGHLISERLLDDVAEAVVEYIEKVGVEATHNRQLNDPKYGYATWDSSSCVWKSGGPGGNNNCDWGQGYIAVGACQSGPMRECQGYASRIYCCKTAKADSVPFSLHSTCSSTWYGGNAGAQLECPERQAAVGICGSSGAERSCEHSGGVSNNKIRCCYGNRYKVLSNEMRYGACEWTLTKNWGEDLICPDNRLMTGECASGSSADCKTSMGLATHMIQCCTFKIDDE